MPFDRKKIGKSNYLTSGNRFWLSRRNWRSYKSAFIKNVRKQDKRRLNNVVNLKNKCS